MDYGRRHGQGTYKYATQHRHKPLKGGGRWGSVSGRICAPDRKGGGRWRVLAMAERAACELTPLWRGPPCCGGVVRSGVPGIHKTEVKQRPWALN
eukprot:228238-Amphidinium_carterae.1